VGVVDVTEKPETQAPASASMSEYAGSASDAATSAGILAPLVAPLWKLFPRERAAALDAWWKRRPRWVQSALPVIAVCMAVGGIFTLVALLTA
jgi:hypothetical protein